jgi:hypothetical protein
MSQQWIKVHMKAVYLRYHKVTRKEKKGILDEFCKTHQCHRKHAIRLFNGPPPEKRKREGRGRRPVYDATIISVLQAIWEAAGYLWSWRLKAALLLWMPWARERFHLTRQQEQLLLAISPAQIDRRLSKIKRKLKRRIYGRTKPGTLLKHHIPIKTDSWNIRRPGFFEVDLVSHSGPSADGLFVYTLDMTDIYTTWVERRAILGKSQEDVMWAIDDIAKNIPFPLLGIDSDNGGEFINDCLYTYCKKHKIQFTRGRSYKKNDNAHVEQKNWTHVRQLLGYVRYDTQEAVDAMNDLYRTDLRWFQNFFQPSVKLLKKIHIGSKIKRVYRPPQAALDRVLKCKNIRRDKAEALRELRSHMNPFHLSESVDKKIQALYQLAQNRGIPNPQKKVSQASTVILARPGKHQNLKWDNYVKQGPPPDLFLDLRFDPITQLQQRLEREAAKSK